MEAERLLLDEFLKQHPDDAVRRIERLTANEAADVLRDVAPDSGAAVVRHMAPVSAAACLTSMGAEHASAILATLPVPIAANLLRRMEPDAREAVLAQVPPPLAAPVRLLLSYPANTAGALMDPLAPVVPYSFTADEALGLIRRSPQNVHCYVYAVDEAHKLAGVLSIRELMLAPSTDFLRNLMRTNLVQLPARTNIQGLIVHPGWHHFDALPVVDEAGVFLGAIRNKLVRELERNLAVSGQTRSGWNVLLALGEMYWVGLGKLIHDIASATAAHLEVPGPREGVQP